MAPSPFVTTCLAEIEIGAAREVLDSPAGTGRHSLTLAALGHSVTVADIDANLVRSTEAAVLAMGAVCRGYVVDATGPLPFASESFDLVLIVDFVDKYLLGHVGELLKPGGFLIYESYSARGENWRQLLPLGQTKELLFRNAELIRIKTSPAGPTGVEAEAVKILARRHKR